MAAGSAGLGGALPRAVFPRSRSAGIGGICGGSCPILAPAEPAPNSALRCATASRAGDSGSQKLAACRWADCQRGPAPRGARHHRSRLNSGGSKLDAFSRWFGERPLVLLWADKEDKARSRFDAAHELGHLVMHSDPDPLDREQERQANMFASTFLMPAEQVAPYLPRRAPTIGGWSTVLDSRRHWGVSAKALHLSRARAWRSKRVCLS